VKASVYVQGKFVTDLRKSATDFGEIHHQLWGNPSPTFRKSVANFWGKRPPVLRSSVTKSLRFGEKLRLARFLHWLGTKLKSHCFERYECLG